ncbi:10559_t:CDS:2 [Diversispora eburnea]|uniref:10559_t:CDS:1 n=1 Tax=Diversispora eburnea TaxID=1213867 RepID=A0A9N9AH59_9GLOM|nr:10559_t:CDS:2 [Diversispora eburnea]
MSLFSWIWMVTAEEKCKGYRSWRFTVVPGNIYFLKPIEIQFNKPSFHYKAGQYLFLNKPAISNCLRIGGSYGAPAEDIS